MRRLAKILVWIGLLGLFVKYGILDPRGSWRSGAFLEKMVGGRPDVTWADSLTAIIPHSIRVHLGLALAEPGEGDGDSPCPVEWRTLAGEFWGREADRWVIDFLIREQWVERIYHHPDAHVQPGDIVLDVGAHLGTFTRFALLHGASKVIAFEPEPTNVICFERTFADEIEDGRVELVAAAAWNESGTLQFDPPSGQPHTGMGRVSEGGLMVVPAVTIDSVVDELGIRRVDFVKMDIVGAERYALAGASRTIAEFAPRMVLSTSDQPDDPEVLPVIARESRPDYHTALRYRHVFVY